jgi:hypothetical protein
MNEICLDANDITRILKGEKIEVIRNGIGIVITADLLDTKGLKLSAIEKKTIKK